MKKVQEKVLKFLKERGWDKVLASDLAKSVTIEAAELLELFQWQNPTIDEVKKDKAKMKELRGELADVFIYTLELTGLLGLDPEKIILEKLNLNKKKYPAKIFNKWEDNKNAQERYILIKKEYRKKRNS